MFWIRYDNADGTPVEYALPLNPTEVEYPDKRAMKVHTTQDGATVIQRPVRDSRPRKWIWTNYGPLVPGFADQWARLEQMDTRERAVRRLPSLIGVWEDVSGVGGLDRRDESGNKVYTTVRVTQVDQKPRKGGGPPMYESTVEFRVEDATYTTF